MLGNNQEAIGDLVASLHMYDQSKGLGNAHSAHVMSQLSRIYLVMKK